MIYTIIVVILILWLLGFLLEIGSGLIHLLLVVAAVLFIVNYFQSRKV